MRTLTAAQQRVLEGPHRSTHVRVRVDRGTGTFTDLSDLEGRDWIMSVDYGIAIDSPVQTANVELKRRVYELNLSTLNDASKLNVGGALLDLGNEIVIEIAVIAQDAKPSEADFVEIHRGQIDELDWSSDPIKLVTRDQGGPLVETFIEDQRVYGNDTPIADNDVEDVIQDILDDNNPKIVTIGASFVWAGTTTVTATDTSEVVVGDFIGLIIGSNIAPFFKIASIVPNTSVTINNPQSRTIPTGSGSGDTFKIPAVNRVTLFSESGTIATPFAGGDSPGFKILPYAQQKESLFSAIRRLAQLIGHDLRYSFQVNAAAFELVFLKIDRSLSARGTLTLSGLPIATNTFVVNVTTFTARNSGAGKDEFNIGSTFLETAANIVTMLGLSSEAANLDASQDGGKVVIDWSAPGTVGNAIVFTEAMLNTLADGGGTLGGTRLGANGKTTPDFTFDPDRYQKITALKLTRQDIRNVVRVTFSASSGTRFDVKRTDTPSIAKFGRRYMEITEGSSSQIDTITEAINLAEFALRDLAEPVIDQTLMVPFFWPAEPGDLYRFLANNDHYDTDQDLSNITVRHKVGGKNPTSSIATRGKPSGGLKRWLSIEGRPGVAPPADLRQDNQAEGVSTFSNIGTIIITYDDPRTMSPPIADWRTTRVHVVDETDAGFPDFTVDETNLVADGQQTRFEIGSLVPGVTYAAKLLIIDGTGNIGAITAVVQQATERVGPFHENLDAQLDGLMRNPDFNIFTLDDQTNMPDFWSLVSPFTYGSSADIFFDQVNALTGDRALRVTTSSGPDVEPQFESDFIPVREGDLIAASALQAANQSGSAFKVKYRFFDRNKSFLSEVSLNNQDTARAADVFKLFDQATQLVPSSTRYVRIRVEAENVAGNPIHRFDRVTLVRGLSSLRRFRQSTDQALTASTKNTLDLNGTASGDIGWTNPATGEFETGFPGVYQFTADLRFKRASSFMVITTFETKVGGGSFTSEYELETDSRLEGSVHIARVKFATQTFILGENDRVKLTANPDSADVTYLNSTAGYRIHLSGMQLTRND